MDGEIVIGTSLDKKGLEKGLKQLESELRKKQKEYEQLGKQKIKVDVDAKKAQEELKALNRDIEYNQKVRDKAIARGNTSGAAYLLSTEQIAKDEQSRNEILGEIEKRYKDINKQMKDNRKEQELLNAKIEDAKLELQAEDIASKWKNNLDNVGNGIEKVTKKAIKWGVAIFGIRTAFNFIRSSINTIANDDEQLKADLDYMRSAIAYSLEPLVRGIVNLMQKLMVYIGYIVKAWFGIDIFAKANKSLKNATGNAKELNKELNKTVASFDEMEILQDQTSSGGGGSDTTLPSFDLSGKGMEIPGWVKWIAEHGDELSSILAGVAGSILAINLGLSAFKSLGIGLIIDGVIKLVKDLKKFVKDPSFENFIHILQDIAEIILGISLLFGLWPIALVAALVLIVLFITEHIDKIKEILNNFREWVNKNVVKKITDKFGTLGQALVMPFQFMYDFVFKIFTEVFEGIKKYINGILKIFKGDFKGGIEDVFGGVLQIMLAPITAFKDACKHLWPNIKQYIKDTVDGIQNEFNRLKNPSNWLPDISGWVDKLVTYGGWANPVTWVTKIPKLIFGEKGMIYTPPKLAVGGVINQPGRGVPVGSAFGGERGMEGVIPLTDSQQMELLGEAIGRYITVDLTNITKLDGRQIARKVERISQNNNFVLNR